jgi:hypothetical protein
MGNTLKKSKNGGGNPSKDTVSNKASTQSILINVIFLSFFK